MAVTVSCSDPQGLLTQIKAAVQKGAIDTWLLDNDGDFTHSPEQWKYAAWFRPSVEQDKLVFYILGNKTKSMSKVVYGVYHGRLIEMLLTHFDVRFSQVIASALPTGRDWVNPTTK